jgi:hypothetical protein
MKRSNTEVVSLGCSLLWVSLRLPPKLGYKIGEQLSVKDEIPTSVI